MEGRRLCSAVFLTYQFDPGFFEQDVLPVFLDIPLSHAVAIRLVQLEDVLRALPGQVAVYYDANGLVLGGSGSAKLDFRRVPVQHRTGIFHPERLPACRGEEADGDGIAKTLILASMSANLRGQVGGKTSSPVVWRSPKATRRGSWTISPLY